MRSGERVLASLYETLCEKVAQRLRDRNKLVSVSGQNVSLDKLAVQLKMPQCTQLLTLLNVLVFYFKTEAYGKDMFEDLCVLSLLSIRTVNGKSFIQRVLSLQQWNVWWLLPMMKASPLEVKVFFSNLRSLFRDVSRKVV